MQTARYTPASPVLSVSITHRDCRWMPPSLPLPPLSGSHVICTSDGQAVVGPSTMCPLGCRTDGGICSSFGILILLLAISASEFVNTWFHFLNTFAGRGCYFILCVP